MFRYDEVMSLKPQDVVVLVAVALSGYAEKSNRALASDLFMSTSEISGAITRLRSARLLYSDKKST